MERTPAAEVSYFLVFALAALLLLGLPTLVVHAQWLGGARVYAFGLNSRGQLGAGDTSVHWGLQLVGAFPGLPGAPVLSVSAGEDHSLLLVKYPPYALSASKLLMFGHNPYGELGFPSGVNNAACQCVASPTASVLSNPSSIAAISAGQNHSLVLAEQNSASALYCFGANYFGQLGLGTWPGYAVWSPIQNDFSAFLDSVKAVSAGAGFSLVLCEDGSGVSHVYAFGCNNYGQLGTGSVGVYSAVPQLVAGLPIGLHSIVAVAAGGSHSLVLTASGNVYAFGKNTRGQLGLGTGSPALVTTPTLIGSIQGVTAISAGYAHSLFVCQDSVYSCGWNGAGQLGLGDKIDRQSPTLVLSSMGATAISAGHNHSLAIMKGSFPQSARRAYAWGSNAFGQLGAGSSVSEYLTPHLVVGTPHKREVLAVAAGWNHSLIVCEW